MLNRPRVDRANKHYLNTIQMRGGFSFEANNAHSNVRSDRGNQSEAKLVTHTTGAQMALQPTGRPAQVAIPRTGFPRPL